jgi:hypothetical protein
VHAPQGDPRGALDRLFASAFGIEASLEAARRTGAELLGHPLRAEDRALIDAVLDGDGVQVSFLP